HPLRAEAKPPLGLSATPFDLSATPFGLNSPPFGLSAPPFGLSLSKPCPPTSKEPFDRLRANGGVCGASRKQPLPTEAKPTLGLSVPPLDLRSPPLDWSASPLRLSAPPFGLNSPPFGLSLSKPCPPTSQEPFGRLRANGVVPNPNGQPT